MIHCLAPVIVQPSPSGSARVRSDPASEPASGSVSANAPIASPRASGGTKRDALLVGAEREQRQRARARVHRDRHAHPRVGARQLLQHEDVREEVRPRAAVLLGDADAHQPELGERREHLAREAVLAIPLRRRAARSARGRSRASAPGSRAARRLRSKSMSRSVVSSGCAGWPFWRCSRSLAGGLRRRRARRRPRASLRAWSHALNDGRQRGRREALREGRDGDPGHEAPASCTRSPTRSAGTPRCPAPARSCRSRTTATSRPRRSCSTTARRPSATPPAASRAPSSR